jgi:hypothetical protein
MTCLALLGIGHGASVLADEPFPKRRAGLWEIRVAGADALGMPPAHFCVGEFTDTAELHLDRAIGTRGSCSLGGFEPAGDAWVAESTCTEGSTTVTKVSVASGDFQTGYRIDTLVTQLLRGGARREDREAVVGTWIGPCEAGQRPGDLVIPGMGTLNMDDGTFEAEPKPAPKPPTKSAPKSAPKATAKPSPAPKSTPKPASPNPPAPR